MINVGAMVQILSDSRVALSAVVADKPRSVQIAKKATGHGNMAAYMKRFGLAESGICGCGQADETVEHILGTCENAQRLQARSLALPSDPFRTEGNQNSQVINNCIELELNFKLYSVL